MGLPGAFVVFGAGGGLIYALGSLYFESYSDKWKPHHDTISKIIALVSSIIALATQILLFVYYRSNTYGIIHLLMEFDGDVGELCLRIVSLISSGLSVFSIYTLVIGEVDTSEYVYLRTTYINGEVYKQEYIAHSPNESKVCAFFMAILVACLGIISNCFLLSLFILFFNLGSLFYKKGKSIFTIIGVLSALVVLVLEVINVFQTGDTSGFGLSINLTLVLMPLIYALLMLIYFIGFFNIEWLSSPIGLIIGSFISIFVAYMASLGVAELIIYLVSLF